MNVPTRIFLVLLQVAIGWHFLYEGYWKICERTWTSKGYIRSANGPLAAPMRWLAGDPDVTRDGEQFVVRDPTVEFIARLRTEPLDPKEDPARRRLHRYFPPALAQEWDAYFERFIKHYQLDQDAKVSTEEVEAATRQAEAAAADPKKTPAAAPAQPKLAEPLDPRTQRILAEVRFINSKNETVHWLLEGKKPLRRSHVGGPAADVPVATPERVTEYLEKVARIHELQDRELPTFGGKLTPKLRQAKEEEAALRAALTADLNAQTAAMKESLRTVLTADQRRLPAVPEPPATTPATWPRLATIDNVVRYGLTAVGACLLLGFLTRLACLAGAAFLLAFYLPTLPLPGLPEAAPAVGHYLIINQNVIEMLALLALAFSRPGERYGIDAMLLWLWRALRSSRAERAAGSGPATQTQQQTANGSGGVTGTLHTTTPKE